MKFRIISFLIVAALSVSESFAQCAMCRTQLENNVSNGDIGIAAGINAGIFYLLSVPYLAVFIIGYFWYRNSKRNAGNKFASSVTSR